MVKFGSPRKISEELAERDDVSEMVWDLRGLVCKVMKEEDYIDKDEACSEKQGSIDAVIKRLIDQV